MFKVGAKAVTTPERPPQQPSGDSETPPDPGCSGSLKMKFKRFKDKKSKKRKRHRENDNSPPNSQRTEEHRKEPEKKKRRISKPKNKALDCGIPHALIKSQTLLLNPVRIDHIEHQHYLRNSDALSVWVWVAHNA